MKAFIPIAITDAMLTTSVPETPPAEYNGATTYALGDTASVTGSGNAVTVYRSLQNGNTGNTPASSPLWWEEIGDTYGAYAGGTTYALGDRVISASTHLVYESMQASNTGHALTETDWWDIVGPTNARAMFTYTNSTRTTVPEEIVITLTPGQRVTSLMLLHLANVNTVAITATSVVGGGTVYSETIDLMARGTRGWWSWLFGGFRRRKATAVFDIPPYKDIVITLTLSGPGDITVGKCGFGKAVFLGDVEEGARSGEPSNSVVARNNYGELDITDRGTIPELDVTTFAEPEFLAAIRQFRVDADAQTVFWAGIDDRTHIFFDALALCGPPIHFDAVLRHGTVTTRIEAEGI